MLKDQRALFPSSSSSQTLAVTEALADPDTYAGRSGYQPDFIKDLPEVPMPQVPAKWRTDRVPVDDPDRAGVKNIFELKYTHFSVVMSKSRRQPYFSCVNIEGKKPQKSARTNLWRRDPRIPTKYQILTDGIYGNQKDGLFSRGHMTRREDPDWGSPATATQADADTFHVTNTCPQQQQFNAPVWLGLENYVLKNTREDNMRVSVFTGPVFDDTNDPWYEPPHLEPVQVPLQFWKVVIFKHDDTDQLASVAYVASQAEMLPRRNRAPAYVFGSYEGFQLRVAELSQLTRLDFGMVQKVDVLAQAGQGFRLRSNNIQDLILNVS